MRDLVGEALGTFLLVFIGCGCIALDRAILAPVAFGLAVGFGILIAAPLSGAHFNPAVTLAFWRQGVFPGRRVVPYILTQIVAATGAALLLVRIMGLDTIGVTTPSVPVVAAFGLEVLITAILMLVILYRPRSLRGTAVAVGAIITVLAYAAGGLTGASMNPARSLGPAVAEGLDGVILLYLTAPILGALAAVAVWRLFPRRAA